MKSLVVAWDRILDASLVVSAAGVVASTFLTLSDIVGRQFFGAAQGWAIEISEYSLVYIAFFGAAWLLREEGHVMVEVVVELLSPRRQALIGMATSCVGVVVTGALAYFGAATTIGEYLAGTVRTETPLKPFFYPLLIPIPVGSAALCVQFARRTCAYLQQWKGEKLKERRETGTSQM